MQFCSIYQPFNAFYAHLAKSYLNKNLVLARLMCLFGLHQSILINNDITKFMEPVLSEHDKWVQSFETNIPINTVNKCDYEAPKILGDVFEALLAAVYLDSDL